MYEDARQRGSVVGSEPEFQSYRLLANCCDSDMLLRIAGTLPSDIFHSEPVQFALDIHSAIVQHNHAKFFGLVRKRATYLQRCLLHRAFRQVRAVALDRIYRTMSSRGFPIASFFKILGFNDEAEAEAFVSAYSLEVGVDADGRRCILRVSDAPFTVPDVTPSRYEL